MKIVVPGYQQDICHYLYSLQQANIYCNVVIATRDGLDLLIPAHSIVLFASQSPVLQGILQGAVGKQHFVIQDFDHESACVLQSMVKSLYTGQVEFTTATIEPLKCLYKRLLLDKFVAVCEEASRMVSAINVQTLVSNAKAPNLVGCTQAGNTIGENTLNIIEESEDSDGLHGTHFEQIGNDKSILQTDKNENGKKRKGKQKSHDPCSQQGELEYHTIHKRKKIIPEVTETSSFSNNKNINKRDRNGKTKNTKTKKIGNDPGGDQIATSTGTLSDTYDGEKRRETTSCTDLDSGDANMKSENIEETDPDVGETARETTSCSNVNSFVVNMKSDNIEETDPDVRETARKTTSCSNVNSFVVNMKSDNIEETDHDDQEIGRETTSCTDLDSGVVNMKSENIEETDSDMGVTGRETASCSDVNPADVNLQSENIEGTDHDIGGIQVETAPYSDVNSGGNIDELKGNKSFADATDMSQETERETRSRTIELVTKTSTDGGQNIMTNSVDQVEPGLITMDSFDFGKTNNGSTKVTGRRVKNNGLTKVAGKRVKNTGSTKVAGKRVTCKNNGSTKVTGKRAKNNESTKMTGEKAKNNESTKVTGEKAKNNESTKVTVEKVKNNESTKVTCEKAKNNESTKVTGEKAKKNESTKVTGEKAKNNGSTKMTDEKAKTNESTKVTGEKAKKNESTKVTDEMVNNRESTKVTGKGVKINASTKVTGKRAKNNGSEMVTGKKPRNRNWKIYVCAHCDKLVEECHCPIGPKAFNKKCPGRKCPLRFLDHSQYHKHFIDRHCFKCVECGFHGSTEARVAQHMYSKHLQMLDEEKYPIMKCDVKV